MYKIRDGVELPETFKMKVTPEQSEALQKHLFSNGCSWNGRKEVVNTVNTFLYVSKFKLQNGTTLDFFNNYVSPEIRFDDYFVKESSETAIDVVLKFLQKHDDKISCEVTRNLNGSWNVKAWTTINGIRVVFESIISDNDKTKANTFISAIQSQLGLSPVGLKLHELARENAILKSDLETARKFDRGYYKEKCSELRKRIHDLTEKENRKKVPAKWCIKVTDKNLDRLSVYLKANSSKYKGLIPTWEISDEAVYFYSESPEYGCHSHYRLLPGFQIIKTKHLKHVL